MERQPSTDTHTWRMAFSLIGAMVVPFIILYIYGISVDKELVFRDLPTDIPVYIAAIIIGIVSLFFMPVSLGKRVLFAILYLPISVVATTIFILNFVCGLVVGRCL